MALRLPTTRDAFMSQPNRLVGQKGAPKLHIPCQFYAWTNIYGFPIHLESYTFPLDRNRNLFSLFSPTTFIGPKLAPTVKDPEDLQRVPAKTIIATGTVPSHNDLSPWAWQWDTPPTNNKVRQPSSDDITTFVKVVEKTQSSHWSRQWNTTSITIRRPAHPRTPSISSDSSDYSCAVITPPASNASNFNQLPPLDNGTIDSPVRIEQQSPSSYVPVSTTNKDISPWVWQWDPSVSARKFVQPEVLAPRPIRPGSHSQILSWMDGLE